MVKPIGLLDDGTDMQFLGNSDAYFGTRGRTSQPQQQQTSDDSEVPKKEGDTAKAEEENKENGSKGTVPTKGTYDQIDLPFSQNPKVYNTV
jgi:hypothetical protein